LHSKSAADDAASLADALEELHRLQAPRSTYPTRSVMQRGDWE
jgi:hypothetical protein